MIRRLIARLVAPANDNQWATVYCGPCGAWMPVGHGCQGGNGR
jgi:hypothetical protein